MRTDGCRIEVREVKPEEPAYSYLTRGVRFFGSIFPTPSALVALTCAYKPYHLARSKDIVQLFYIIDIMIVLEVDS